MIGEERIQELTSDLIGYSTADQTEVVVTLEESGLTRFANSAIHQNVMESNAQVRIRVVLGKKIGVATSNSLDRAALRRVLDTAMAAARTQPENPIFSSLPQTMPNRRLNACDNTTANCTPEDRAAAAGVVCAGALDKGLSAAGSVETGTTEYAVANSLGVWGYDTHSAARLNTVVMSDTGSGYAERNSVFFNALEPAAAAREAIDKALSSRNPVDLPPGEYVTLLEEYAVGEMLFYLSYMGLSAQAVQEGRSFMNGKFGKQIADPRVSIWDDGWDPRGIPWSFDFEGVPKQRVEMISRGIANAVVYDSYTAGKEGKESTGHALPAPNPYGPMPMNLFMSTGDSTKEQMLASVERGLWVTRFHYVNVVHPMQAVLTGMTRDGTFLIENGKIVGPVKNLRFTQGVLEVLSRVRAIGNHGQLVGSHGEGAVVPALLVDGFRFTGATQF